MTTTYTITVQNHSASDQSYVLFQQPPQVQGEVYTNAWASFENVPVGGFDAITYTDALSTTPGKRFYINDLAHEAGELVDHSCVAAAPVEVDFTDRSETTAVVVQGPNNAFHVHYE